MVTTVLQEDSLVNSVGTDFKLNHGQVAIALASKASPKLQLACDHLAPIKLGDVQETAGYGLSCKKVLHCNVPGWKEGIQVWHICSCVSRLFLLNI